MSGFGRHPRRNVELRTLRSSLATLGSLTIGATAILCGPIVAGLAARGELDATWDSLVSAGASVQGELDWSTGIVGTALIALHAYVVVGHSSRRRLSPRDRRVLAVTGMAIVGGTAPLLALVLIARAGQPHPAGHVVLMLTVALLFVALATQLGRHIVFTTVEQLNEARATVDWTSIRIADLQPSGPFRLAVTAPTVAILATAAATAISVSLAGGAWHAAGHVALFHAITLMPCALFGVLAVRARQVEESRTLGTASAIAFTGCGAYIVFVATHVTWDVSVPLVAGVAAGAALLLSSCMRPHSLVPRMMLGLSIWSAGAASASAVLERRREAAKADVERLTERRALPLLRWMRKLVALSR